RPTPVWRRPGLGRKAAPRIGAATPQKTKPAQRQSEIALTIHRRLQRTTSVSHFPPHFRGGVLMASPTRKKRRNAAQLAADGFAAMVQHLGMADAVRYVQLYHQGSGDYSRERQ